MEYLFKLENSNKFWALVNQQTKKNYALEPDVVIAEDKWISFISDYFKDTEVYCHIPIRYIHDEKVIPWITPVEVQEMLSSMNDSRAAGPDGLPAVLFKKHSLVWLHFLSDLFNNCIKTGKIADNWKGSITVPIFKKESRENPGNYRLLAISDTMGKILCKHLLKCLTNIVDEKKILPDSQGGFRKGLSTVHQCHTLNFIVQKYFYKKTTLYACYIDYTAAFDSIPRIRLWEKMACLGIPNSLIFMIKEFYENTWTRVCFSRGYELSKKIRTEKGVKQGCVLAPLLYNLYVCDIEKWLDVTGTISPRIGNRPITNLAYADDSVILDLTIHGLQKKLDKLVEYCKIYGLRINKTKTKLMVFGSTKKMAFAKSKIIIEGVAIEKVKTYKYLGLIFCENGNWAEHLNQTKIKAENLCKGLRKLHLNHGGNNMSPLTTLFKTKVQSVLLYGAEVWGSKVGNILENCENKCLKMISGLPPSLPSVVIRNELGIMNINVLVEQRFLKFHHQLKNVTTNCINKLCMEELMDDKWDSSNQFKKVLIDMLNKWDAGDIWDIVSENVLVIKALWKNKALDMNYMRANESMNKLKSLECYVKLDFTQGLLNHIKHSNSSKLTCFFIKLRAANIDNQLKIQLVKNNCSATDICGCKTYNEPIICHIVCACPKFDILREKWIFSWFSKFRELKYTELWMKLLNLEHSADIARISCFLKQTEIFAENGII